MFYLLHSIMYLLILKSSIRPFVTCFPFTFHNVSINSCFRFPHFPTPTEFTFHNVSINSPHRGIFRERQIRFTFHNVSINSGQADDRLQKMTHLHSIMYLLIPKESAGIVGISTNLHSIMYLLIP